MPPISAGRPPRPRRSLVIGSGGLLGKALTAEISRRGESVTRVAVPWSDAPRAVEILTETIADFITGPQDGAESWRLFWCAGTGVVSTGADVFADEKTMIDAVLLGVAARVGTPAAPGSVFFASSAGALYAGSGEGPFDETSTPSPLAPYGRSKIALEAAFGQWAGALGAHLVTGRISNLYGPGQNIHKPQGLVSQLIAAHLEGRPSSIYVPLETVRDYLFVEDAAAMILDSLDLVESAESPGATLKLFASQVGRSISEVIATVQETLGTELDIRTGENSSAALQALDLRFRSRVLPSIDARELTTFSEGVRRTALELTSSERYAAPHVSSKSAR